MFKYFIQLFKSIGIAIIISTFIIIFILQTVCVEGNSMYKTLNNGDRLIVEKVSNYFHIPAKGEIVVFKCPSNEKEKYIKRVVAVAGDKIKIENDTVYVNDKRIKEPYIFYGKYDKVNLTTHYYEEKIVPKDSIFVLGDNRYDSEDSRSEYVGFVNKKLIVGKVVFRIYPFKNIGRVR